MTSRKRAFTIIELLVVVAIIALLVGILLPAIQKGREQAMLTRSVANLRNLGVAHAAYAASYDNRQLTIYVDSISTYGLRSCDAFESFAEHWGRTHPNLVLGWGPEIGEESGGGTPRLWQYFLDGSVPAHQCWAGNPITMTGSDVTNGFGPFRFAHQTRAFSPYISGRYYDPTFFAMKEPFLYEIVSDGFDSPAQFASILADDGTSGQVLYTSSYCLSPAAMYSPDVFSWSEETMTDYQEAWEMPGGLRSPSMSQARYPNLKTHMIEHQWLQNVKQNCNPGFQGAGVFNGCEPYYFNQSWSSEPATLFYDGHVEMTSVRDAQRADGRVQQQSRAHGLWSRDTPLGENGYFIEYGFDQAETSYHILTTDGIKGRDVLAR